MKADPFAQLRLLDLQALDSALDRLAHRRRTLPELADIARLDARLAGRRDQLVAAQTQAGDLARASAALEEEIEVVRARHHRNDERMASGAVAAKQLQDLEHENASLARRQSDLEDRELELMEQAETVQQGLDGLQGERDADLAERASAEQARDAALVALDAEVASTRAQRDAVAAELPTELLALYERIRSAEGGIGVGPIERGRCGGCRLDLMGNEKAEVRAASPDEVLRHEECSRIMVRTAESGL